MKMYFRRRNNNSINNVDSQMNQQEDRSSKSKYIGIFSFFVSGIPLVAYPFVFIASVMELAGHRTPGPLRFNEILIYMFYILTIVYPVVYIISCLLYFNKYKKKILFIPYVHLLICIIIFTIFA